MNKGLLFGRVGASFAGSVVLVAGAFAGTAQAAPKEKPERDGSIKVCKKVVGSHKDGQFKFVLRDKEERKKVFEFWLSDGKCVKAPNLDYGTYRIVERELPKGCELKDINVKKGKYERINITNKAVLVVVGKDSKKVEVEFKNECKHH